MLLNQNYKTAMLFRNNLISSFFVHNKAIKYYYLILFLSIIEPISLIKNMLFNYYFYIFKKSWFLNYTSLIRFNSFLFNFTLVRVGYLSAFKKTMFTQSFLHLKFSNYIFANQIITLKKSNQNKLLINPRVLTCFKILNSESFNLIFSIINGFANKTFFFFFLSFFIKNFNNVNLYKITYPTFPILGLNRNVRLNKINNLIDYNWRLL